jgi:DNA integrity scanning protein DisA with diadenylate cyclase activity
MTDGAVVMSKRYELLGFGGEISGKLDDVETVLRALDVHGDRFEEESTKSVGTRHRSAYRLCKELPDVLAVVVSKDGDVRFVRQLEGGQVAYWDQD